LTMHYWYK